MQTPNRSENDFFFLFIVVTRTGNRCNAHCTNEVNRIDGVVELIQYFVWICLFCRHVAVAHQLILLQSNRINQCLCGSTGGLSERLFFSTAAATDDRKRAHAKNKNGKSKPKPMLLFHTKTTKIFISFYFASFVTPDENTPFPFPSNFSLMEKSGCGIRFLDEWQTKCFRFSLRSIDTKIGSIGDVDKRRPQTFRNILLSKRGFTLIHTDQHVDTTDAPIWRKSRSAEPKCNEFINLHNRP